MNFDRDVNEKSKNRECSVKIEMIGNNDNAFHKYFRPSNPDGAQLGVLTWCMCKSSFS